MYMHTSFMIRCTIEQGMTDDVCVVEPTSSRFSLHVGNAVTSIRHLFLLYVQHHYLTTISRHHALAKTIHVTPSYQGNASRH